MMLVTSLLNELRQPSDALLTHNSILPAEFPSSFSSLVSYASPIQQALHPSFLLSLGPDSTDDFAPILNVPALISFVAIALAFVSLQVRVTSIGDAADRRTEALKALRIIKSQQLEGKATLEQVNEALQEYEQSFEQVERLRDILPGVRIRPPPVSAGLARTRMQENEAAAKQFLGIEPSVDDNDNDDVKEDGKGRLALPLVAILVLVLVSQLSLLALLANDPMSSSMDPSMTTREVLDAVSGFE